MPNFSKWTSGQEPTFYADDYNYLMDMASANQQKNGGGGKGNKGIGFDSVKIKIQNSTSSVIPFGGILAIDSLLTSYTVLDANMIYKGVATTSSTTKPICVVVEPIAANAIGSAIVFGIAIAKITSGTENSKAAKLDDSGGLTSDDGGAYPIVSISSNDSYGYAAIQLGGAAAKSGIKWGVTQSVLSVNGFCDVKLYSMSSSGTWTLGTDTLTVYSTPLLGGTTNSGIPAQNLVQIQLSSDTGKWHVTGMGCIYTS